MKDRLYNYRQPLTSLSCGVKSRATGPTLEFSLISLISGTALALFSYLFVDFYAQRVFSSVLLS